MPDFRSHAFLLDHIRHTMAFYHPRAIDPRGGFFHFFRDDGTVYDANTRHLVSSTRFVFNYAMAWRQFGDPAYRKALEHGLTYLRERHRSASTGGYAWLLNAGGIVDATNHCYGLAFVLLAYAHAFLIQVAETALSNGRRSVEQRLARWLLMSQDRIGGDKIALTHEFLALMLGVRRPGVTMALHVLEGNKLIRSTRGLITVLNRAGLEKAAGASYGIAEAEAQRVIAVAQDDNQGGKRSAPMVSA